MSESAFSIMATIDELLTSAQTICNYHGCSEAEKAILLAIEVHRAYSPRVLASKQ